MAFDDDFISAGLADLKLSESTGLTTAYRLGNIKKYLSGEQKIPDEHIIKNNYFHDRRNSYVVDEMIAPKIEKSQKTIIMDEPESGLSIHLQKGLWEMINEGAKSQNLQVIVATHSPFALLCDANFIELESGYVNTAKQCIVELGVNIG